MARGRRQARRTTCRVYIKLKNIDLCNLKGAMLVLGVPTMNKGDDKSSYANNSNVQKAGMLKAKSMLDKALQGLCNNHLPQCLKIADLGCSSGPNTLLFISNVVDTIVQFSQLHKLRLPQFQVFLNDLPQNDFNNLFKLLPPFYEKLQQPVQCFVSATPGSFYSRLFPSNSMHFIHSSYSVHWLSQPPNGLENNKGNTYITKTTPPDVIQAYSKQYQKDFSTFLSLRAEEMISGGRMVLIIACRDEADHAIKDDAFMLTMISAALADLAAEGLVKEADIDSFNIPMYLPHKEEVTGVVESEGSFKLNELEVLSVNWDDNEDHSLFDKNKVVRIAAGTVRAAMEPLLASHFGSSVIDPLFERYMTKMNEYPCEHISNFITVVRLTRK